MTLFKRHGVVLSSGILAAVLLVAGAAQAATFSSEFGVGTQDQDVTTLQTWLTGNGYYSGPITGYYGSLTEAGVERFQSANGISATGYVGPLTLAALNQMSGGGTLTGTVSTSANATELAQLESELNSLLAQIQTLEATPSTTPTASTLSLQTSEGVGLSGTLAGSGSAPLTYSITSNPLNGTISSFNSSTGTFVYTPNANYTGSDTFSYNVSNSSGTSAPVTVSVNVQSSSSAPMIPAPPVGQTTSAQTTNGAALNGTLTATGNSPYMYQIITSPTHGTISNFETATGSYTYTPTSGYYGSDSFTYEVGNGMATSSPYTVTVTNVL